MKKLIIIVLFAVSTVIGSLLFSTIRETDAVNFQIFDLAQYDPELRGFHGTIYDDGFVYFTPDHNGEPFGKFVRYDTNKPFDNFDSWQVFDSGSISEDAGYLGGGTDGKFLYFPSYNTDIILRYDTMKDFQDDGSWEKHHIGMKFWGESSYDGNYVYFLPEHHTMITRFNVTGDFTSEESWESCDLKKISESADFMASAFDGKFLYLPSSEGRFILKYDAEKQFCDVESWEKFDVTEMEAKKGYFDAKFNGHHVYFSPHRNDGTSHGTILRYDTTGNFTDLNSWTSFNPSHHGMNGAKGYGTMTFVNDHIFFSPLVNWRGYHSNILSYDTNSDFSDIGSWSLIKTASYDDELRGYPTSASDGYHVYFSPYHNNLEKHGKILKIPAFTEK